MVNIFLNKNSYNTPGNLYLFQNFTHELLPQGTYGSISWISHGEKNHGHGFELISRGNCAREYGMYSYLALIVLSNDIRRTKKLYSEIKGAR